MKILVAEDDAHLREGLAEILRGEGYTVVQAADGAEAMRRFDAEPPDLVCLDIMMPRASGYDVCRHIRARDAQVPVIFLSAKAEEIDKVVGLELGADDYVTKPFGVREVVARIRAVTRRAFATRPPRLDERPFALGDLEVSPAELRARRGDQTIDLSLRDVKLLRLFAANPGKALDRNTLMDAGWGEDFFPNSRALDQHISQLRKRIERDPQEPRILRTVHGVGYRYEGPDDVTRGATPPSS
jgi:DNA-binding response OmpR family regulator